MTIKDPSALSPSETSIFDLAQNDFLINIKIGKTRVILADRLDWVKMPQGFYLLSHLDLHKVDINLQIIQWSLAIHLQFRVQKLDTFDMRVIIFVIKRKKTLEGSRERWGILCVILIVCLATYRILIECDRHLRRQAIVWYWFFLLLPLLLLLLGRFSYLNFFHTLRWVGFYYLCRLLFDQIDRKYRLNYLRLNRKISIKREITSRVVDREVSFRLVERVVARSV